MGDIKGAKESIAEVLATETFEEADYSAEGSITRE